MAKRVFFSFHFQDVIDFRANVVRNHWLCKEHRDDAGFFDASLWESTRRTGDAALRRLINDGIKNTSVTVVLIGEHTHARRWVRYEIMKSLEVGNRVFGVHINGIKCRNGQTKTAGPNPFDYLGVVYNGDGSFITGREWNGQQWVDHEDLPTSLGRNDNQSLWNNGYRLSHFYQTYDWVADNGYEKFASWVDA